MLRHLRYVLLIAILFCVFGSFKLLPFADMRGFHVKDIGNVLIWFGIARCFFTSTRKYNWSTLHNIFTLFIIAYLLLVLTQVSLAAFFYNQSMLSGLIRVRDQFFYGSFFLFLLLIDTRQHADMLMRFLFALSLILICLALINHFGPTIYYKDFKLIKDADIRSGVRRAVFPGVSIILAAGLWHLVLYIKDRKASIWSLVFFLITYAAVIFRQTRGRIIALTITVIIILFSQKRYIVLAGLTLVMVSSSALLGLTTGKNILFNQFALAYENYAQETGTWAARMIQIEVDWEIIRNHLFLGSGGLVVRDTEEQRVTNEMRWASGGADLGYMSWLKYFGLSGALWMVSFVTIFYIKLVKLLKEAETDRVMAYYAGYMFTYILIAEVTLDSFYRPAGIVLLCMTLALLVNSEGAQTEPEDSLSAECQLTETNSTPITVT